MRHRIGLLLVLIAGCASPNDLPGLRIVLEDRTIVPNGAGAAVVRFTAMNAGWTTVTLSNNCGSHLNPTLEKEIGGNWVVYSSTVCDGIGLHALSIPPGVTQRDSISFHDAGTYRLVIPTDRGLAISPAFYVN
jgi:hypothetical protein